MSKLSKLLGRVFRGEDVVFVQRTKEQWEHQFAAGKWDRLQENQPNTAELARLISEFAQAKGGPIRVLDVGCGNGGLARLLVGRSDIAYTGIDISEAALGTARAAAPGFSFIAVDAEQPPPDMGTYDVLVFNEVLYYMNPDRVLPRYRIHAAPDARVFVSVIRFWRTPFIFHRIRRHLKIDGKFHVADASDRWDIVVGHFL